MIRVCNYNLTHKKDLVLGEKEPLSDKSKTHTFCLACNIVFLHNEGCTKDEIRGIMKKRRERRG
jgi:hypothetical protein